jgi:alkylglycerol monooxygenase
MDMNVYAVATPAVLAIVAAEAAWCLYQKNAYYRLDDAMANFGTAIGHQVTNVAVAAFAFGLFTALRARWPLADWGATPLTFAALYVSVDFLFYWFHRMGHAINFLWAAHAPHHSSEELNYTVGLRASVTQRLASFLFYWPLALVARPEVVLPLVGLHLLFQLIPHTRVIKRLPRWIEAWLNTPTHHRVHHGINPKYLDRNFGGTFIIWDKLFGTYAEETEPVVYGVLRPVGTWSPVEINLQYWRLLWRDAKDARGGDKLKLWFMPNGWRPEGLPPRPPLTPVFGREKLRSCLTKAGRNKLLLQLPVLLGAMFVFTRHESPLPAWGKAALGAAIWIAVIGWGRELDADRQGIRTILPRAPGARIAV